MAKGRKLVLKVINVNLLANHRISQVLKVLKIARSTYYGYLHWQPGYYEKRRSSLKSQILTYWLQFKMYGAPRLKILLKKQLSIIVSQRLISHLMHELNIQSCMVKKYNKPTTTTEYDQRPNLMKDITDLAKVVATDMTYIRVNDDWLYLASVYQPETRRVLAFKIGTHMTQELAASPVEELLKTGFKPTIIHSDMGSPYTSDLFEQTLRNHGIKHSYSRKGRPGDNARIESFHSILKREYVSHQTFTNRYEVIAGIDAYIRWYNAERISLVA